MVKYREMRASIIAVFKALSDREYQKKYWIDGRGQKDGLIEDLDSNIGAIYNTYDIADDPYRHIGWSLRNATEARAIEEFDETYQRFFERLEKGTCTDSEVISLPGWQDVVDSASKVLDALLSASDRK